MPLVSIIIPNYNRGAIIGETIENMLSQSLQSCEVIIVDDGSIDNSLEVIKSYGNKVILIQQTNKGPGAARNAGLKIASGDFIQFMDSDDFASLNKVQIQVEIAIQKKADVVYGPWVKVWKTGNMIRLQDVVLQQQALPEKRTPLSWFLTDWSMVFQHCLVRKDLLQKVGGYREDMYSNEDSELFIRLLLSNAKLEHETKSLTFYRLDDFGKLTNTGLHYQRRILDLAKFYELIISMCATNQLLNTHTNNKYFKLKVWKAIQELSSIQPLGQETKLKLANFTGKQNCQRKIMSIVMHCKNGLKQRTHGHRWNKAFNVGPMTEYQKKLVLELGWTIIK